MKQDREAVKTLAIAVGVREAARQVGIPEATVQAWSAREKWFAQPKLPPTITNPRNATIATKAPSQALLDSLTSHSKRSKIALAKAGTLAAEELASMPGKEIVKISRNYRDVVGANSQLHGWEERGNSQSTVNFNVVADHLSVPIQINQHGPQSNEDDREHASEPPSLA